MNVSIRVRRSRRARVAAALVPLAALVACGGEPAGASGGPAPTTRFSENGVTVTLSVSGWKASKGTLTAVFTPEARGFHLYSTDLPPTGIEGVGRPTTVSVTGALGAEGTLRAAAEVRSIEVPGVDAPVPVYPDGPVTTTLAVRASGNGEATVLLGYASCSTRDGCTIPVSDRPVRLRVTDDGPTFAAS
ncbi:hypothetical protein [Streptomyces antarcticus]|uniref:hypothetical protein n=1 Tax=Streptomyces antarcticus TaxID=2996458 RepID=UPI0022705ABA|nr:MULTISPECIES: hypothetical protein [unclassified Streptomyces]MCY0943743.1 hypothetical protein [Streptomyces sp. H34-AA3]MCZ4086348.1 hypothetical protein [Streptomyces sp. H34-S5]